MEIFANQTFEETMYSCSIQGDWAHFLAAGAFGILALPGLVMYVLILVAIIGNWHAFSSNPYYKLLISHGICDCIICALYLFYSLPSTLLQCDLFGLTVNKILGTILTVSWFVTLCCFTVAAINRYWAVCRYSTYDNVFSGRNFKIILAFVWLCGIFCGIWQAFSCCGQLYWFEGYSWGYDVTYWNSIVFVWLDRAGTIVVSIVFVVCYVAIIRKKPTASTEASWQQIRNEKIERSLAFQFGIVGVTLCTCGLTFTGIPEFTSNPWMFLLLSEIYLFYSICNPIIYLTFNNLIREHVKAVICRHKVKNVIIAVVGDNPNSSSSRMNRGRKKANGNRS